ncbi:FG-GAP repeat domain-containing protein [Sorangium sp. So ce861]|uniref:FG-GAP repeat domain-containing protein n=1 Tax=Sorangium sp. So ce861 TaxID=3133323 RepID=UPI003F62C018
MRTRPNRSLSVFAAVALLAACGGGTPSPNPETNGTTSSTAGGGAGGAGTGAEATSSATGGGAGGAGTGAEATSSATGGGAGGAGTGAEATSSATGGGAGGAGTGAEATSSATGGGAGGAGPVQLTGAVEKGPFVVGSSVAISALRHDLAPTGRVFLTATDNDLGHFGVELAGPGPVSIEGEGFYYNEVTGRLSGAPLTLRALFDVAGGAPEQTAYVNLITHLAYERARVLADGAGDLTAAVAQAEGELRAALGIGPEGFDPHASGVEMNALGGDNDANAYLLAVGAVVLKTALLAAGEDGPVDATMQQLINQLSLDLASDGALDPALVAELAAAAAALDRYEVKDLLGDRLEELGSPAEVPDIDRFFDEDGDGFYDAADTCRLVPNPSQSPLNAICSVKTVRPSRPFLGRSLGQLYVRDADQDGLADLIVGNMGAGSEGLGVLRGKGTGRLEDPVWALPPSGYYGKTVVADFNEDGDLDAVDVFFGLFFIEGGPGATFLPPVAVDPSFGASSMVAADFDGDGHQDVAAGATSTVTVLLGDGTGGFVAASTMAADASSTLAVGDFDADGNADLAAAHWDAMKVSVWLGDGAGGFDPPVFFAMPSKASGVAVGDFDGDGDEDLVVSMLDGRLRVLVGNGAGGFTQGPEHQVSANYSSEVQMADFTGDGKDDVVANWGRDGVVHLIVSEGTAFGEHHVFDETNVTWDGAVAVGDLNGDGKPDIVYGDGEAVTVLVINL